MQSDCSSSKSTSSLSKFNSTQTQRTRRSLLCYIYDASHIIPSLLSDVTHLYVSNLGNNLFRKRFFACSSPSYYPDHCRMIVKWILGDKCHWNSNKQTSLYKKWIWKCRLTLYICLFIHHPIFDIDTGPGLMMNPPDVVYILDFISQDSIHLYISAHVYERVMAMV